MKKKILAVMLLAIVAIIMLVGCSDSVETEASAGNGENDLDIIMEDSMEVAQATPDEGEISGEAVITSTNEVEILADTELLKEETRARNEETLMEIIDSIDLTDEQKQDAADSIIAMTEIAEKEAAVKILLEAKGFTGVKVSISGNTVEVVVNATELNDDERAQIEDVATRKTGIPAENIIISTVIR